LPLRWLKIMGCGGRHAARPAAARCNNNGPSNTPFQGLRHAAQPTGTNFSGFNVSNTSGQNRIQMATSDVASVQGFAERGAPFDGRFGVGEPSNP
jgi:hypothetical protein